MNKKLFFSKEFLDVGKMVLFGLLLGPWNWFQNVLNIAPLKMFLKIRNFTYNIILRTQKLKNIDFGFKLLLPGTSEIFIHWVFMVVICIVLQIWIWKFNYNYCEISVGTCNLIQSSGESRGEKKGISPSRMVSELGKYGIFY